MSEFKLIASDMDGTFLREDGSFDREHLEALLPKLKQAGQLFTVASGRAMLALEKIFAGFDDQIAFVAENGSFVQYQGQILFEAKMPKATYLNLLELLDQLPDLQGYMLSGRKGAYVRDTVTQDYIDHVSHYYENIQPVRSFDDIDDDIFKVTIDVDPETIREREAWLSQQFEDLTAMTTGFQSMDIVLSHVDKSTGLRGMCQKLGIDPSQILAFGDNMNDYQMLELAGHAVATANARDEIKAISQEVIGHCNDQVVLSYIEGLVE